MLFSLLKHYLDTDTALKVSQSVYCFTTSISHGVEKYFPRLWGMGISDAIFKISSPNSHRMFLAMKTRTPSHSWYTVIIEACFMVQLSPLFLISGGR